MQFQDSIFGASRWYCKFNIDRGKAVEYTLKTLRLPLGENLFASFFNLLEIRNVKITFIYNLAHTTREAHINIFKKKKHGK